MSNVIQGILNGRKDGVMEHEGYGISCFSISEKHKPISTPSPSSSKSPRSGGLSELSKQLRALQADNDEKSSQIEKLERKLKVLADLKGVSVGELRNALREACEGEAHNELRSQITLLKQQLALAIKQSRSPTTRSSPKNGQNKNKNNDRELSTDNNNNNNNNNKDESISLEQHKHEIEAASTRIATLELKIGELEEVEETLGAEVSKVYKKLRQETTKATTMETAHVNLQKEMENKIQKFQSQIKTTDEKHLEEQKALQAEIDRLTGVQSEMELKVWFLQEDHDRLKEEAARAGDLEREMALQQTQYTDRLRQTEQEAREATDKYNSEIDSYREQVDRLTTRAVQAELELRHAQEKLNDGEKTLSELRELELKHAQQTEQLKEYQQTFQRTNEEKEMAHKAEYDSAHNTIRELRDRIVSLEHEIKTEKDKTIELEQQMAQANEMEQLFDKERKRAEQTAKKHVKELRQKEKARKEERKAIKAELEQIKNHIIKYETKQKMDRDTISVLERKSLRMVELENANRQLVSKLEKMTAASKAQIVKEEALNLQLEQSTQEVDSLTKTLRERDGSVKVEHEKTSSLESELTALQAESKLRKDQFNSRAKVQEERIHDLEQQLSSLYTAFHIERRERTEEQQTQAALQVSLGEADLTVAQQIHTEEERRKTASLTPTRSTPVAMATPLMSSPSSFASPSHDLHSRLSSLSSSPYLGGSDPAADPVICDGFLFKRDRSLKGWRKRYFYLQGSSQTGIYSLTYSDGLGRPPKDTIKPIRAGISVISECRDFAKHPHAFTLYLDPKDPSALVFHAAAKDRREWERWYNAIQSALKVPFITTDIPARYHHPVGSQVVIVDLVNCPEFNGCTGTVKSPLKDGKQCIIINETKQKVKLSPANLELFAMQPESSVRRQEESDHEVAMRLQQTPSRD